MPIPHHIPTKRCTSTPACRKVRRRLSAAGATASCTSGVGGRSMAGVRDGLGVHPRADGRRNPLAGAPPGDCGGKGDPSSAVFRAKESDPDKVWMKLDGRRMTAIWPEGYTSASRTRGRRSSRQWQGVAREGQRLSATKLDGCLNRETHLPALTLPASSGWGEGAHAEDRVHAGDLASAAVRCRPAVPHDTRGYLPGRSEGLPHVRQQALRLKGTLLPGGMTRVHVIDGRITFGDLRRRDPVDRYCCRDLSTSTLSALQPASRRARGRWRRAVPLEAVPAIGSGQLMPHPACARGTARVTGRFLRLRLLPGLAVVSGELLAQRRRSARSGCGQRCRRLRGRGQFVELRCHRIGGAADA